VNRDYWIDTAERCVRAFAAAVLSVMAVGDGILNAFDASWLEALGVGLGAAVLSLLTSLTAVKLGNKGTASLTDATVPTSYADAVAKGRTATGLGDGPA
jgi:hypothetical protein